MNYRGRLPYRAYTKAPKYNNHKCEADGYKFDSEYERNVYYGLKIRLSCGDISDLRLQVPFELQEKYVFKGKTVRAIKYVADFVFVNSKGETEVWDAKGFKTKEYLLKKKIFEYKYGIEIKEVRNKTR